MKVADHIDKIFWSFADKMLFVGFGIVSLFQMRAMDPGELGLFALLINMHTWVFVLGDSFALQNIIQFGAEKENRGKVNLIALILLLILCLISIILVLLLGNCAAELFSEPRFSDVALALPILTFLTIPRVFTIKLMYRDSRMHEIFFANLAFFGTMTALTIYYLKTKPALSYEDLILIYYIGTAVSSALGIILKLPQIRFSLAGDIRIKAMFGFSTPVTLASILNYVPRLFDVYIVQFFFSTSTVGVYYLAKNLFRVFDEALSGSMGLVYPAAVRLIASQDEAGLKDLASKALSFLLMAFLAAVLLIELGFGEFFIHLFMPEKYYAAVGQLNLLALAAIGMPFIIISAIINASGKSATVLAFVTVSVVANIFALFAIGFLGDAALVPLGLVAYNYILAAILYYYAVKHYKFNILILFRAVKDSISFIKNKLESKT